MQKTVNQVAKLSGVSIRTLHWYDKIGLLCPAKVTDAGYRLYGDEELERLQQILFFRELGFELKDIKAILDSPNYDKTEAMKKHKELLTLKLNRLKNLINLVDKTMKGESEMSFKEFDMAEIEKAQSQYKKEAEERWGSTDAFKQSQKKTSLYTKDDWARITAESDSIHKRLAENMDKSPCSQEVQRIISEWQAHIIKYYYDCTREMLSGLGEMYVADERFTKNIDKNGKGLALFMCEAIKEYCK
jgi:DNA-binding transcriptional MerR regulator